MTKQESEQLQEDIITYGDNLPDDLITQLCEVIVNWYKNHKTDD